MGLYLTKDRVVPHKKGHVPHQKWECASPKMGMCLIQMESVSPKLGDVTDQK